MDVLLKLPAPGSLRVFVARAVQRGANHELNSTVSAAIDQYEHLIRDFGGSVVRLQGRIKRSRLDYALQTEHPTQTSKLVMNGSARHRHFESAAEIMGMHAETVVVIDLLYPDAVPNRVCTQSLQGYVGIQAEPGVSPALLPLIPIVNSYTLCPAEAGVSTTTEDVKITPASLPVPASGIPGLLEEYSTKPLPTISTRMEDAAAMYVVDLRSAESPRTNLFFANSVHCDDPRQDGAPLKAFARRLRTPTKWFLHDIYIHRSIRTTGRTWCNAFHPMLNGSPDARMPWSERLPNGPRIEFLGIALQPLPAQSWNRIPEATLDLIRQAGVPFDEFVGYRCETPYPYWGATYSVTFELERA